MFITIVAGARPNFVKISPIIKSIYCARSKGFVLRYRLVHTGQHYDKKMSHDFFHQLQIPEPDINLECGGGSQAEQTASIMVKFETELMEFTPDVVLVVGDVTSTMACTITARKLCIDVAHVEAGIRSGDMTMPEEINRIVTDSISNLFFTTSRSAGENLISIGIDSNKIFFVGNTMIDTLYQNLKYLHKPELWESKDLNEKEFYLLTLHRPSNVDDGTNLRRLLDSILTNTNGSRVVFPVHPRTCKILNEMGYDHDRLIKTEPTGYLDFIYLLKNARGVITDSGGITEEATVLNIPCITMRNSTERPETVTLGTNELAGTDPRNIAPYLQKIENGQWKKGVIPELWDGQAATRIMDKLIYLYN